MSDHPTPPFTPEQDARVQEIVADAIAALETAIAAVEINLPVGAPRSGEPAYAVR